MSTPHNNAKKGDIAKTVLLPGDPLRAKYLAKHYLKSVREVTSERNMLGFTGTWQGKEVTVMGSGMGGASAGIYAHELFDFYDVDQIIRIGTAGGLQAFLEPGDMIFAMTASTDSNYAYQYELPGTYSPCADFSLMQKAVSVATENDYTWFAGGVFSSDMFSEYNALGEEQSWKTWAKMGCLVQDMETYAVYCVAAYLGKRAFSILTHTDSCVTGRSLADSERLTALEPMFLTALGCIVDEETDALS